MSEVIAFPEQRLPGVERQRIGKAIAEIQSGDVTASLPEVCVSLTSQPRLVFGHRLDDEFPYRKQLVETSTDDRITLAIQNHPALEIACRREPSHIGIGDRVSVDRRVFVGTQDRDDCRSIDDHAGSPRSS